MLPFERRVVEALITSDDPDLRADVVDHVDGALAAMPEVTRAGFAGETVVLAAWAGARRRGHPTSPDDDLAWLERHPLGLVRQWVRALRSLVLFAENEMLGTAS